MDTARELSGRLASLYRNERNAMADFLVALAAFDERKAWRELGYPSLWAFLRHELKLSKSAAFHRKTAAELIQAYPVVAAALRSGELCLSTVAELGRVLTPEIVAEVLPRFFGLSHREAEALSASLRPAEVIPTRDVVRLLPPAPTRLTPPAAPASPPAAAPASPPAAAPASAPATPASLPATPASPPAASASPVPVPVPVPEPALAMAPEVPAPEVSAPEPRPPAQAAPRPGQELSTAFLDAERARLSVTVPRRVLDKLEAARDALAHVIPDGNLAGVLEHALDLVLAESRKKRALVEKPRKGSKPPRHGSRHVPAEVARAVWKRSGERCECMLPDGERCGATRALEIDHIDPFARGGEPTVENLRIACRPCNLLAARRAFGDAVVDRYAQRKERRVSGPAPGPGSAGPLAPPPRQDAPPIVT